ncbi:MULTISPECIES: hypothetical protein [Agrobacterium]|uniref:Uncharacterized protein n=1 Tax=Agrobacterium tumefaciens TaxID=358 RepID=A0AAE6B8J2_AGRTU|nr:MULTISPECIES: hypothetical protein [Agrobacterium]QCL72719.1 hypothetical protein CFBP5499_04270 [Agrobacterium tumefaciens]QCL78294.1 hypothetical protein CFBP5877_03830 [Agrobacterium tumefaciens]CUX15257.1 hypothetical protein AGR6A_Cc100012 [Agrobacterium sp. NCPPB 925]
MNFEWSAYLDFVKPIAQFAAALFIAWITVWLALGRYKKEKHWDRKLQAYSDVLAALGTMNQILNEWIREEHERREETPEHIQRNTQRYRSAMEKIEETSSVAALILFPKVNQRLRNLISELHRANNNDQRSWLSALQEEHVIVEKARDDLVEIGKSDLELNHSERPLKKAIRSSSKQ